jgi:hypothetical protein
MGNPGGALIEPNRSRATRRIVTCRNDLVGRCGEGGNRGSQFVSGISEKTTLRVKSSGLARK